MGLVDLVSGLGPKGLALVLLAATVAYHIYGLFYNLFLHPLASYPGPLLWRASRLPWTLSMLKGRIVLDSPQLHETYGPVVRVAPNELAFVDARAWRDVMGGGASEIPKWKGMYGVPAFLPPHVQNTVNKDHHRALRKLLAPGFSDASLRAQEHVLRGYVDLFIRRLRDQSQRGAQPVDLELWYRYLTFDIICELAVGESFRCLESDDLHPWIKAIVEGGQAMLYLTALNMYPTLAGGVNWLLKNIASSSMKLHKDMVKPMMMKRIEAGERPDLVNPLLKVHDGKDESLDEILSNATAIVGAGSETSAGTLAAVTSFLVDDPERLAKLASEVRSAFTSAADITADAVAARLPYLCACIDESLRLFPQTGSPSMRLTDRDVVISGLPVPKGTIVGIWSYAMYRNSSLWTDPHEFRPERWLGDARYANDARDAFKPFFTGSRDCIGQNLALLEMRLILARVVYHFDLLPAAGGASRGWAARQGNAFIVWDKSPLPVRLMPVEAGADL